MSEREPIARECRDCERTVLADRVGLDLEVEVDADVLEELILDGDEPDLDRHLKVRSRRSWRSRSATWS